MTRHSLAHRGYWLVLGAAPIAVWLAVLAVTLTLRPARVATGDPLLDAYLQQVVNASASTTGDPWSADPTAGRTEFQAWFDQVQAQYATDPRYYLMRFTAGYSSDDLHPAYISAVAGVELKHKYEFLEQALERGAGNGQVAFLLWSGYQDAWRQEAIDALGLQSPGRQSPPEEVAAYHQQLQDYIDQHHGAVAEALYADWHRWEPAAALPYYLAALDASDRGAFAPALELLAQGNAMSELGDFDHPPYDMLARCARDNQPLVHPAVMGALASVADLSSRFDIFRVKHCLRALKDQALARGDRQAMTILHRALCRLGRTPAVAGYSPLISIMLLRELAQDLQRQLGSELPPEQAQDLGEVLREGAALSQMYRTGLQPSSARSVLLLGSQPPSFRELLESMALGPGNLGLRINAASWDDLVTQQQNLAQQVWPAFEKLEGFDYVTLSWDQAPGQ